MSDNCILAHEKAPLGHATPLAEVLDELKFNADGLIPAIAQQHDTGEVLMMAWMNRASIEETLETNQVCYWSRSRQKYWRKGEESGHVQKLKQMRIDCDGDTLLLLVDQLGAACHTYRSNCFYNEVQGEQVVVITEPQSDH